jgi:hypothetical protein
MRNGLGYKYEHHTLRLADFVAFMEKRKARIVTTKLALDWAALQADRHASWALRLSDVRGFARHVANFDPRTEAPPVGMLPGWKRAKPSVYDDAEIDALLTRARQMPDRMEGARVSHAVSRPDQLGVCRFLCLWPERNPCDDCRRPEADHARQSPAQPERLRGFEP